MKKKLFLFAILPILTLTSCTIEFTNNPAGSIYDGSSSSAPSEPTKFASEVTIPSELNKYEIVFNANHITTQPDFKTIDQVEEAISIYDFDDVIESVNSFTSVAYGPSCLVIKQLEIQIKNTFNYSYVSINATPFYVRNIDHSSGDYRFITEKGYLGLNDLGYYALKETHTEFIMDVTECNYQTNSKTLNITAFDDEIFINSISFYY